MHIIIIGAGASGMAAALTASENHENRVTLLERQARVGKKLSATGNGRCNLSNRKAAPAYYHGEQPEFTGYALNRFPVEDTLQWFSSLGLYTAEQENGKLYPFSEQASSVADVLRLAIEESGIMLRTGCEVRSLKKSDHGFVVKTAEETIEGDCVIVSCGGLAGTKLGGTMDGYALLRSLGHTTTRLYPSLVQLCTDSRFTAALKGVRTNCAVTVFRRDAGISGAYGEVQFTEYGLSGPAIFEISRVVTVDPASCRICLDLLPEFSKEALLCRLKKHISVYPERTLENLLTGLLQNRLGRTVLLRANLKLSDPCASLPDEKLQEIAQLLKCFEFEVVKTMGMDQAQVTAGGIRTSEFYPETLESRLIPGLYACGEVLDVDGDCGGYNLQWAWSSGRLAGTLSGRNMI